MSAYQNICLRTKQPHGLRKVPDGIRLLGLSKKPLDVVGWTTMKFFGKQLEFYVVNNCTMVHDILLGNDSLHTLRVTMSYNPDTGDWVKIAGRKYFFNKNITPSEMPAPG